MYETHFGLKSRPFGSKAEGNAVFVGPQQAKAITGLHKGLGAVDGVVTVIGLAGAGKTTIVERALEQISPGRTAARIGRMQLSPQEALELLFGGFGIKKQAQGTIRRFAAFRQLLAVQAAADAQVAIIIEDAERIGVDAMAELEAITAADTGDGTGANIILMGQSGLNKILMQPELARLNQRIRLRAKVEPLSENEIQGYLKHAIRQAGGDFDQIFDPAIVDIVFDCSQGIPRVVNTICEMAMTSAMEDGATRVSATLMHQVAVDAFGYEGPVPQDSTPPASVEPASTDNASQQEKGDEDIGWESPQQQNSEVVSGAKAEVPEPPQAADVLPLAEKSVEELERASDDELPPAARNIVVESGRYPELPELPADSPLNQQDSPAEQESAPAATIDKPAEPVEQTAAVATQPAPTPEPESKPEPASEVSDDVAAEDGIPELINDTQPELSQLSVANVPTIEEPEEIDLDAGSTAIQEKPDSVEALAAAAKAADAGDESPALEDVLKIDAGDTNVMQGITPNLDKVAATSKPAKPEPVPEPEVPSLDDLPTLSDSMRVDVDEEVGKAKAAMGEDAAKEKPPQPAPAAKTEEPSVPAEPAEPPAELVLEPDPEFEALAASGPAEPETSPVSEAKPEPAVAAQSKPKDPSRPAPVAQVSEMTARIALIDPDKRSGDVDALEAALDAAKKGELDRLLEATAEPGLNGGGPAGDVAQAEEVPEITLDEALADQVQQSPQLDEFAEEIARANSLEEFSDKMAETLFGNEDFDAIAADVVANPPQADPGTPADEMPEAEPDPVAEAPDLKIEEPAPKPMPPISPDGNLKESQAIRMEMLDELRTSSDPAPTGKVKASSGPGVSVPKPDGPQPNSIEHQITTSITQNLEALDVSKMADSIVDDDEPAPKKSGGLFARFRKSS